MSIHQLAAALAALRISLTGNFPRGATALLLEIMAACCTLLLRLSHTLRTSTDPRIAAAHAQLIETLHRYTLREQLHSIIALESTGAHLLTDEDLAAVRTGTTDFSTPAHQHSGRAHYLNTADFAAKFLDLNAHEAMRRVNDAHLLIARRAIDGSTMPPRLTKLADLYTSSADLDPRMVARAARALDSFEPTDTCFEGLPLAPTALHSDGQLLEDHAVQLLTEPERNTRESLLNNFISAERKARKETTAPECGLFLQSQVGDRDIWKLVVAGDQREEMRSHAAQSDNPRTDAGKSARADQSGSPDETQASKDQDRPADDGPLNSDALFNSNDPMPPWAQDPTPETHPLLKEGEQNAGFVNPSAQVPGDGNISVAQRRLNALLAAMKNSDPSNTAKTVTPKIAIHIKLDALADLKNLDKLTSITEHGLKLGPADTGQLICQGDIYRVIFGPNSQPLDVGRSQRFFTEAMKRAIYARDKGCIVPGCTAPVEMLEYHHNNWWENGGCTSSANGSCLCRAHHHAIHAGLLTLSTIGGLAYITLPKHLDPLQIPARNRIHTVS